MSPFVVLHMNPTGRLSSAVLYKIPSRVYHHLACVDTLSVLHNGIYVLELGIFRVVLCYCGRGESRILVRSVIQYVDSAYWMRNDKKTNNEKNEQLPSPQSVNFSGGEH